MNIASRRLKTVLALIACTVALAAIPAAATPADEDGDHTVTICHATNSKKKPWVAITIDVAAFDGEGEDDHSHHVAKDGRRDYVLADGKTCPVPTPEDRSRRRGKRR